MNPTLSSAPATSAPLAVSLPEAGRLLNLCLTSIYKLARSGQLATFYVGKSRRVPLSAIHRLMDEQIAAASGTKAPSSKRRQARERA